MVDVEMILVGTICTFITFGVIIGGFQQYKAEERRKIEEEEIKRKIEEEERKRKEEEEEEERRGKEVIFTLCDELKIDRGDVHATLSDIWIQAGSYWHPDFKDEEIKTKCFTNIDDTGLARGFGRGLSALITFGLSEVGRDSNPDCDGSGPGPSIKESIDSKNYDHNIYIFLSRLKDILNGKDSYEIDDAWISRMTGYNKCDESKNFIFKNKNDEKYCCNIRAFMKNKNHSRKHWLDILSSKKGGKRRRRVRKTKRNKS